MVMEARSIKSNLRQLHNLNLAAERMRIETVQKRRKHRDFLKMVACSKTMTKLLGDEVLRMMMLEY